MKTTIPSGRRPDFILFLLTVFIGLTPATPAAPPAFVTVDLPEEASPALYPGQEIPVTIRLYTQARLQARIENDPEIELHGAVRADFTDIDEPVPGFFAYSREARSVNDRRYLVSEYSTVISATTGSLVSGRGKIPISVLERQLRPPPIHPLFESTVGDWLRGRNRISIAQEFSFPEIPLRPLPPVPPAARFTGLVGDWRISFNLNPEQMPVDEPVELVLEASGSGSPAVFQVPELTLPGFAVQDPDIRSRRESPTTSLIKVRWILLPTTASAQLPPLKLTTFCPRRQDYVIHEFKFDPAAAAPDHPSPPDDVLPPPAPEETVRPRPSPPDLIPEKTRRRHGNRYAAAIVLTGLVIIIGIAAVKTLRRPPGRQSDPRERQRAKALSSRKMLVRQVRDADQDQLAVLMKKEVVPWLIEVLQQPPGTTADALAGTLRETDPELAAMVGVTDHLQFVPELKEQLDGEKVAQALNRISHLENVPDLEEQI